ncbi:MAG: T9SS type A sorting domain-containing protein [Bacteroidales bacterium]|nr:T9SS type A sorting domain-containing protein [Bacteroidales bacterium]
MKSLKTLMIFFSVMATGYPQTPDFSNVGFGASATGGGMNGTVIAVTDLEELRTALMRTDSCILKIQGTIAGVFSGYDDEMAFNILEVESHKTILGVDSGAFLLNIQLYLKNAQNIIIRNIKFSMIGSHLGSEADIISVAPTSSGECRDIWIDHCEFYNETPTLPETAEKKDLYDGMIDIKKTSHHITVSWNYFHDHWKCSLIGYTDSDTFDRKITFHHNHFKNIRSRVPSYRGGTGHIYNNYFEGLADPSTQPGSDGINTRERACLKVEGNYFRNYNNSIYCAIDDVITCGFAYGSGNVFDNSPPMTAGTCSTFTPPYSYILDSAVNIPDRVMRYAGVGKLDAGTPTVTSSRDPYLYATRGAEFMEISPNPVSHTLNIKFLKKYGKNMQITIIDDSGKVMIRKRLKQIKENETISLDLSSLPKGHYVVRIADAEISLHTTIIKLI